MSAIPKASINDLINTHSSATSGQINGQPVSNPISDFINTLAKYAQPAIQAIQNNPQVQQVENSPMGQLAQGHFGNIIPSAKQEFADLQSGKYKPQLSWGGEMEEVPGMGFEPSTGLPKGGESTILDASGNPMRSANAKADIGNTAPEMGSYTRDVQGNIVPNKNRGLGSPTNEGLPAIVQKAQTQGMASLTPEEKATLQSTPIETTRETVNGAAPGALKNEEAATGQPATGQMPLGNPKGRTHTPGTETSSDITENTKRNLQYTQDGISSPGRKAQVNATLNGYGIKGSMDSQLQGIEDQKGILSKAAQTQVAQDGGTTAKTDLLNGMVHDVSYNGSKHTIPSSDIPNESQAYLNNVYVRATGGDPTKINGNIMPDQVPDTVVQKMKSIMGQDASNTFTKDPAAWTKQEQIARYGRNSFDTILDAKHPQASQLNNDMSDLYDAQESIMKGANKENTEAAKAMSEKPSSFWGKAKGALIGVAAGGGILAEAKQLGLDPIPAIQGGLGLAEYGFDKGVVNPLAKLLGYKKDNSPENGINNNNGNPQGSHTSSISNYLTNVKSDPQTGHISLPEPAAPVTPLTPGTPEYTRASNSLPGDTRTFMSNAKSLYIPATNTLIDDLNTMPLDLWHSFKNEQDAENYFSNPKNPYAKQVSDLNAFNSMYQGAYKRVTGEAPDASQLLTPGLQPEQLKQRFATMVQLINDTYSRFYVPYAQTSEVAGNNANNGIQQYQQSQSNDFSHIGGGSLPPLNSIPSVQGLPPIGAIPTQ